MALVDYGLSSSSSSSEDEEIQTTRKEQTNLKRSRPSLPTADALLGPKLVRLHQQDSEEVENNPDCHGGRIRSFKHERGNWATYVYVPAETCVEQLEDFQNAALSFLEPLKLDVQPNELPFHLSLSRTIVLQHHQIEEFSKSLKDSLESQRGFCACLQDLRIYTNEERTRTFIAVEVNAAYKEKLCLILKSIDQVMLDYRLPRFYDPPSFHVSLLWCVGDHENVLQEKLSELRGLLETEDTLLLNVNKLHCKCGNKQFIYKLK
ncbi:U6 snRNA phosphodiesterase 1 [Drosophila tropicalis]|uniref:U6 snRNA phosphodiesterase 1 n=1 Tax=Drosophila tropicalis TaxID=46794 RepID=UPI0035AB9A7B